MPAYFKNRRLRGSVGNDLQSRFMTPYDVDWGFLVNFNHDFMGKAALEKIAQNPPRKIVTLEWNAEDVGSAYSSQRSEEHTSELQSLMRISYAVFCLKKKNKETNIKHIEQTTNILQT